MVNAAPDLGYYFAQGKENERIYPGVKYGLQVKTTLLIINTSNNLSKKCMLNGYIMERVMVCEGDLIVQLIRVDLLSLQTERQGTCTNTSHFWAKFWPVLGMFPCRK